MTIFQHLGGYLQASRKLRGTVPTAKERSHWVELRDNSWRKMCEPHRRTARRIIELEEVHPPGDNDPRSAAEVGQSLFAGLTALGGTTTAFSPITELP
jgi:hypothetical protein